MACGNHRPILLYATAGVPYEGYTCAPQVPQAPQGRNNPLKPQKQ